MMWSVILLSLFVGVRGSSYGCPTNVTCIEKETCCETNTGLWACCPIEDGLCCDDGLHCCSKGQTCLPNGNCSVSTNKISAAFPLRSHAIEVDSVTCPDESSCPDGNTCCVLSSGQYGCCPILDAVCCSDHLHCCPNGYRCDVEHSKCEKKVDQLNDVPCPGGSSACPDGSTCCLTREGDYGCCPLTDAVCCSDRLHCCPHGYTCDIEQGTCNHRNSIPWLRKTAARREKQNIINGKEMEMFELSVSSNSLESIPILKKESSSSKINPSKEVSVIQCPDEVSYCPEETTCCALSNGSYGCCPYLRASCCSDKIHCCGNGYLCDQSGKRCIRQLNKSDRIESSLHPLTSLNDQTCPDGKSKCSPSSTCCQNEDKSYSCCPYSKGVCCGSNGSVCCPNNYVCDEKQLSCQLSDSKRFLRSFSSEPNFNQCGSSDLACSNDQTCCKTFESTGGEYACCGLPDAQCCQDGRHCCPKGSRCDIEYGGCIQN